MACLGETPLSLVQKYNTEIIAHIFMNHPLSGWKIVLSRLRWVEGRRQLGAPMFPQYQMSKLVSQAGLFTIAEFVYGCSG